MELRKLGDYVWEVPKLGSMNVPVRIYASDKLLEKIKEDGTIEQAINVASLPGIQKHMCVMPDGHRGYGMPIGGVAAFDLEEGGISPGMVGFDINCGVRILRTNLTYKEIKNRLEVLVDDIFRNVPAGVGETGKIKISLGQFREAVEEGMKWAIREGYGWKRDLYKVESYGTLENADLDAVSDTAIRRGIDQFGTLGSGNHFLEIQVVDKIYDPEVAKIMGIEQEGQVTVMIHCLPENSKVLTEFGFKVNIKDLEKLNVNILTYDFSKKELVPARVGKFWKFKNNKKIIKVKTFTGKEIICTEDHPIWTLEGWKEAGKLKKGELVLISPFEGVEYKERTEIILTENDLENVGASERIIKNLKKKGLVPLSYKDIDKVARLARLVGYAFGDGWLGGKRKTVKFIDKGEVLKRIKRDIELLGFSATIVEVKKHKIKIDHINKVVESVGKGYQLVVTAPSFEYLLKALGVPEGKKVEVEFDIPEWIKKGPKWVKRLFLAGFFGAEGNRIRKRKSESYRIENIKTSINKIEDKLENGVNFMDKIRELLEEFGIKSSIYVIPYTKRKDGKIAYKIILRLSSEIDNIINFCKYIGYEYNIERMDSAIKALQYYLFKRKILEREVIETGKDYKQLLVTPVQNRKYKIESFYEFVKNYTGGRLVMWDAVEEIREEKFIEEVYDITVRHPAHNFVADSVVVSNTGSRGFGHQIASDYLDYFHSKFRHLKLPDRELIYAPFQSEEGQKYWKAMACAANFAWNNRQIITYWVRKSFEKIFKADAEDLGIEIVYDVAHNIAKIEEHKVNGKRKKLLIHRKGATRAFPAGHHELVEEYKPIGQPVLIPGSMGTASYILLGLPDAEELSFMSSAHGAGRSLSRAAAKRKFRYGEVINKMRQKGIIVKSTTRTSVVEEVPEAYKDIDEVVKVTHELKISKLVVRLRPLAVIKG